MTCRHHREEDDVSVKDFVNVPRDESVIAEVVKTVGPVAVTVHVSPDMQFYELGMSALTALSADTRCDLAYK